MLVMVILTVVFHRPVLQVALLVMDGALKRKLPMEASTLLLMLLQYVKDANI